MFDRFLQLPPPRQILLVGSAALLVGLLIFTVWYALLRTPYRPLFGDLRTTDAATIVAELDRRKVPYQLANDGATILVPGDQVDALRLSVMTEDLPLKGTVGFELFNKTDLGLTDFAQKINYQRALQGELERTIMTLDGVESARVHLSLGEDRIFRDDRVPPKASVTVRMRHGVSLSADAAQGVQRLIAAAVPNLDIANVVILGESGQVVENPTTVSAPTQALSPAMEQRRAIEQYYEARIRSVLERNYPLNAITVSVLANVDGAQASGELPAWSPDGRQFGLKVVLTPAIPLIAGWQQDAQSVVSSAISSTQASNDEITFNDVPAEPAAATEDLPQTHAAKPGPHIALTPLDSENPSLLLEIGLAAIPILLLGVVLLLILRARAPRRLTDKQRNDFAAKLRSVLDKGAADVASQH